MFFKRNPLYRGSRARDFSVSITTLRDATVQGVVTHLSAQQSRGFRSLLELLSLIHNRLEELGMPVPGVETRSWQRSPLTLKRKGEVVMNEKDAAATEPRVGGTAFLVRILFRQNATWMGEIHWLEGEKKLYFRSLLEMVMLMQEALERTGTPQAEYSFRTWDDWDEQEEQKAL